MDNELIVLAERVEAAANNVERARNRGLSDFLGGWEHLIMRDAAAALRARSRRECGP